MVAQNILYLDIAATRALADGLGTAGEQIRVIARGGALADGMAEGFPGAASPNAYHDASRRADQAMGAVATAMMEMSGTVVGAVVTYQQRDRSTAAGITTATEGAR
ncbi:hypothetical protein [Nocardia abscessus]|uniref:hypothetical protein n=1 Tax=Nocardia abscessus TaxID=120957 RepID=UPI002457DF79|nr:hypothetical protein [Nocardia abscessus]